MLTVIIPIGPRGAIVNNSSVGDVPIWLETIKSRPVASWSLSHIEALELEKRYLIISTDEILSQYNIEEVISLYTDSEVCTVRLKKATQGMPCSILMASDNLNNSGPVLVTSIDQYIDTDLNHHLDDFASRGSAAGCVGFESVHPKWSYAIIDQSNMVMEVREKYPISTHALTSTYYFSDTNLMMDAIKSNIMRGNKIKGQFFLAPCLNELILKNIPVAYSSLKSNKYINFYSEEKLKEFSSYLEQQSDPNVQTARKYVYLFENRDIDGLRKIFSDEISLVDSFTPKISGVESVLSFYSSLLCRVKKLRFVPLQISSIGDDAVMIRFKLTLDNDNFEGVDILYIERNKISSLEAFLHKSLEGI